MVKRKIYPIVLKRLLESRQFIQVLFGPRQVGKTTLAKQVIEELSIPSHYISADEPTLQDKKWIHQHWESARSKTQIGKEKQSALLIIDEIQKISGWSETIKRLWDEDTANHIPLKVLLLGSSPLLMQRGLTESLAGRFETISVGHWSFSEMKEAFDWDCEKFIFYGGYPGAASLTEDHTRWSNYIIESLIETTLSRDIFLMTRVDKPALLRRLFYIGCEYSGQVLSYQKMMGQLQDAGNTVTLAHYLGLLGGAGLLMGLSKYSEQKLRQRNSSPKLMVLNTGLMSALSHRLFEEVRKDGEIWGRFVESAIGAHLLNDAKGKEIEIFYWSDRKYELDFILRRGKALIAIEVKSGRKRLSIPGVDAFCRIHDVKNKLLIGTNGIFIEEFLSTPLEKWFD